MTVNWSDDTPTADWSWTFAHEMATQDPSKPDHNRQGRCPLCKDVEALVAPDAPAMGATDH